MIRQFNPALLQGNLGKHKYFEGWFQKIYSHEHAASFILIYGFATGNMSEEIGFIQLLIPGHPVVHLNFSKDEIELNKTKHSVQFGHNIISDEHILIQQGGHLIDLRNQHQITNKYKSNSMGSYYLVPGLPCYHAILQNDSSLSGTIKVGPIQYNLHNASGYLEKNWGTSFPEKYFWMHAQDPKDSQNQLLFSQADVIWQKRKFTKHFGHLIINGKHLDLRKIPRKKIKYTVDNERNESIYFQQHNMHLHYNLKSVNSVLFKSPQQGTMSHEITHNVDVPISIEYKHKTLNKKTLMTGNIENSIF